MKKLLSILAMTLVLCLLCSSAFAAEYTLKFGYGEPADPNTSLEHVTATAFKEYVEEKSEGRIEVELYSGGVLGDSEALLQQVTIGSIQGCPTADAKLASYYAPIQVISIPYLFENREIAQYVLDSEIGESLREGVQEATGMRLITIGENGGFRCFTNNAREIRTPEDMKGLKFRVMSSSVMMKMVEE